MLKETNGLFNTMHKQNPYVFIHYNYTKNHLENGTVCALLFALQPFHNMILGVWEQQRRRRQCR